MDITIAVGGISRMNKTERKLVIKISDNGPIFELENLGTIDLFELSTKAACACASCMAAAASKRSTDDVIDKLYEILKQNALIIDENKLLIIKEWLDG